jgi:hypothetical protein
MKLAHFFIDHPRFATVINVFIVLVGLAMLTALPVAQYPNIVPPTVQITASYPGASGRRLLAPWPRLSNRRSTVSRTWTTSPVNQQVMVF